MRSLAEHLCVSPRTIEHHLSSAYRKLGVDNRTELLAAAAHRPAETRRGVTRYARSGEAHIAYQVIGEGTADLVVVPGFISNVETAWTWPAHADFLSRLARGRRLIVFDKRGTGLSDPVPDPTRLTLEDRMDEVRAVMDAAGSKRATLFGFSEGVALSVLFAATHASRTDGLILYGALVSGSIDSHALGTAGVFVDPEAAWEVMQRVWGTGRFLAPFGPSAAQDPDGLQHIARFERHGASPSAAYAIIRMAASIEVRALCPVVRAPALVLHRRDDALVPVGNSRYLAEHLPSVRYVELDGRDHPPWLGRTDEVIEEVERFMASRRPHAPPSAGVLLALVACDTPLDAQDLRAVERFRGRPTPSPAGIIYSFEGPVRAAACALSLAREHRKVVVHAGEVRFTEGGLDGRAIAVIEDLLTHAVPGTPAASTTVRELALGSALEFHSAGRADVRGLGEVDVLHLSHGDRQPAS